MALNLKHQKVAQFAARFREKYKSSSQEESAKMATWLLDHIDAGDFTDAQARAAFGFTAPQYATLKAKFNNLRTNFRAIKSAQGE